MMGFELSNSTSMTLFSAEQNSTKKSLLTTMNEPSEELLTFTLLQLKDLPMWRMRVAINALYVNDLVVIFTSRHVSGDSPA